MKQTESRALFAAYLMLLFKFVSSVTYFYTQGRAIAQAVSRCLPTAAARVLSRV
jgi:hypothetical protein